MLASRYQGPRAGRIGGLVGIALAMLIAVPVGGFGEHPTSPAAPRSGFVGHDPVDRPGPGPLRHAGVPGHLEAFDQPLAPCAAACAPAPPVPGFRPSAGAPSWENLSVSGRPGPSPRQGAVEAFDTASGELVLFGGEGPAGLLNDTWTYEHGNWTLLTDPCPFGASTCPPPLAYGAMGYDNTTGHLLLVGGITSSCPKGCNETLSGQTWIFANGVWVGSIPAPITAFGSSLAWDSSAPTPCLLLFGGDQGAAGPSNATYCFFNGAWSTLTTARAPSPRWGAGMVNTSVGTDLLFGGTDLTGPLNDTWEFYEGNWTPVTLGGPASRPAPRGYPAMAESPAADLGLPIPTDQAVLFGGEAASGLPLGDTWLFTGDPPGAGAAATSFGNWTQDLSAPAPTAALGEALAPDFTDSLVVGFGGLGGPGYSAQGTTWGYFHPIAFLTTSATELDVGTPLNLTVFAAGGEPPYTFGWSDLPSGCVVATTTVTCAPTMFGIYNVSVIVTDQMGRTAAANVTVQVDPAGASLRILSEYSGYFYQGLELENDFGAEATLWGGGPTLVTGAVGGTSLNFTSGTPAWSSGPVDMGEVAPGTVVHVAAHFSNWTLHATLPIAIIETPDWMRSFLTYGGPLLQFLPSGDGPWNQSYEFTDPMDWAMGSLIQFALPTPGLNGSYSLIPESVATYNFSSSGTISLAAYLSSTPTISLGPVSISASAPGVSVAAGVSLSGNFSVRTVGLPSQDAYTIAFSSAQATVDISFDASFTINIFPAETPEGKLGLSAVIDINPGIAVTLVLGPSAPGNGNFLSDLDLTLRNLIVQVSIAITLTVQVGIDNLFEIGLSGSLALDVLFQTLTPHLADLWLNASVAGFVQFLFLTISFTFWQGTIYAWGAASGDRPLEPAAGPRVPSVDQAWKWAPRYYNSSGYEVSTFNSTAPTSTAISNIYPAAAPVIASGKAGAIGLYTSDDVQKPENVALGVHGFLLNASGRTDTAISVPSSPGAIAFDPAALGLPDGATQALWGSLPVAGLQTMVPASLGGFSVQSDRYSGGAWGPAVTLAAFGDPLGYRLSSCPTVGPDPLAAVLDSPVLDPNATTPERLLVYDAANGVLEENQSVIGLASLDDFDCSDGWVLASGLDGLPETIVLGNGPPVSLTAASPPGYATAAAAFVSGGPGEVALLERGSSADELVVTSLASGDVAFSVPLPQNSTGLQAFAANGGDYVFVGTPDSVLAYFLSDGSSTELPTLRAPRLVSFGAAPEGSQFVVFGLDSTGSSSQPIRNLVVEILGTPTPAPSPAAGSICRFLGLGCDEADLVFGIALAALVATGAVIHYFPPRRREPSVPDLPPDPATGAPVSREPPAHVAPIGHPEPPEGAR